MDTAETAGGEDVDACPVCEVCGGRHRGRARAMHRQGRSKIPDADLGDVGPSRAIHLQIGGFTGDAEKPRLIEPDPDLTIEQSDGGRSRAMFTYDRFDLACSPQVVRPGQAVADDRAFQRDDRLAGLKRSGDLRIDPCQVRHVPDATRR
jgi:hypothetical protein